VTCCPRRAFRPGDVELDGNFKLGCFEHDAFYDRDRDRRRIEMHFASQICQKVTVAGSKFDFRAVVLGDPIPSG
jgi:uncharacterized SAM-dependent methyltransferase